MGYTRLKDAQRILERVCAEPCDVFIFLGDLAKNARPGPTAYAIAIDALSKSPAKKIIAVHGNHDHQPQAHSCLNVLAEADERVTVYREPQLVVVEGIQIGILPWVPTARLFSKVGNDLHAANRSAGEALGKIANGLAAELDPDMPSVLVGHWLVSGERMGGDISVMETREPIPRVEEIEYGWDVVLLGHNHVHQKVGGHVWSAGPPMRGGFGEEDVDTGFMTVEWEPDAMSVTSSDAPELAAAIEARMREDAKLVPKVEHVQVNDRPMLTFDLDPEQLLKFSALGSMPPLPEGSYKGAVVRLRCECSESQAEQLNAAGGQLLRSWVETVQAAGANKVIGPQLKVQRTRRVRSDLTSEVDPSSALDRYLEAAEVEEELRPLVKEEAARVMGSDW